MQRTEIDDFGEFAVKKVLPGGAERGIRAFRIWEMYFWLKKA